MTPRWLAVGLVLVAATVSATSLPVKRYALFVGANQGGRAQQPLLYAQRDALKMQQVMQEVGGVGASDRILLLDPDPDEVSQSLADLGARMNQVDPGARRTEFLFYYSGHSDEDGLLLGDRALTYKSLRDALGKVPADVRIAILDSCSSGAFARMKGGVPKAPFLGQETSQMTGHAFLTSSSENEASQESDTLQGSFFTHYLVSGLRGGADRVGDGLITLNEAYEYAFQNTLARTESTRAGPQHPSYEIQLSGTGNLILSDVKAATARLELAGDVSGKLYVRNPSGVLFAEVAKDPGSALALALPPGVYTVTAVTPKKSLAARVTVTAASVSRLAGPEFQEQDLARFAVRGTAPDLPEETDPSLNLDLARFTLGLATVPLADPAAAEKTLAVSVLVDFANAVQGLQAAGLVSLNRGTVTGVQTAGIGVISQKEVTGLQAGGVFSLAGSGVNGLQFAGVFAVAGGESSTLWQGSGVFNLSRGKALGLQTAGVANVADRFTGVQLSLVNVAGDMKGLQVGLVNVNSHIEGAGFGLVFVSPDAYYHPTLLWDQNGQTLGLFQWGMGSFYWLTGVVFDPKNPSLPAWETLGGAGVKVASRYWFWDTDAGWNTRLNQGNATSGAPFLRTAVGLQSGWAALEAGVLGRFQSGAPPLTVGPFSFEARLTWFVGLRLF